MLCSSGDSKKIPQSKRACKKVYVLPQNVKWQSRNYTSASAAVSGLDFSLVFVLRIQLFLVHTFQSDLSIFHFIYLFTCFIFLGGRDVFHLI